MSKKEGVTVIEPTKDRLERLDNAINDTLKRLVRSIGESRLEK